MAIIIHSNAIIEEMHASNLVFTEDDILNTFNESYHTMCSKRISEVPNTWAVWALMDNPPENEYNLIGSDILDLDIDSPLLIIHDSEINPEWKLTDDVLQKGYDEFLKDVSKFINDIAANVVKEDQEKIENGEKKSASISLKQLGITPDKKLLFLFDLNLQSKEFFVDNAFYIFSQKIIEYLQDNFSKNLKNNLPFTIFDDNKTVVIVNDDMVEQTLVKLIETFGHIENYENCKTLHEIKEQWLNRFATPEKRKRGRPKKS